MDQQPINSDLILFEISQKANENANTRLFVLNDGSLLKQYTCFDGNTKKNIHNLKVISMLRSLRSIKELELPMRFVYERKRIIGYAMRFCPGITLENMISSDDYPPKSVLQAFLSLANVINKLPPYVSIGDLHGKNVLVDLEGKIHIIDLDGFSIWPYYQLTCPIAHIFNDSIISSLPKYLTRDGKLKISRDTDIFCFFILFMQWIMQVNPVSYTHSELIRYFRYLEPIGFPIGIIEMIRQLFRPERNYLRCEELEMLDVDHLAQYSYNAFVKSCGDST